MSNDEISVNMTESEMDSFLAWLDDNGHQEERESIMSANAGRFETSYEPVEDYDRSEQINRWLNANVQTETESPLIAPELFEVTGNADDGEPVTTNVLQCEESPLLPPEMTL